MSEPNDDHRPGQELMLIEPAPIMTADAWRVLGLAVAYGVLASTKQLRREEIARVISDVERQVAAVAGFNPADQGAYRGGIQEPCCSASNRAKRHRCTE